MKWFKHYSTARNDERLSNLEDKTGLEGYGFYFKTLEVVAEVMNETDVCEVTYSMSRWGRQLNISTKKFLYLSQCCSDVGLLSVSIDNDKVTISTPNILKYRDNHTKNLQATCKEVVSNLPLEKEKEKEKEKDKAEKEKPLTKYSDEFLLFWKSYPKKTGKGAAFSSWKQLRPPIEDVLKALEWQKVSQGWIKEDGEYIPNPATYLNQRRWEDEPKGRVKMTTEEFMRSQL